jgi:hypothetical protein
VGILELRIANVSLRCVEGRLTHQLLENWILHFLVCGNIQQNAQFWRSLGWQLRNMTIQSGPFFYVEDELLALTWGESRTILGSWSHQVTFLWCKMPPQVDNYFSRSSHL